jgi:gluconokinase
MTLRGGGQVVIGVDIGTTRVKALALDAAGQSWGTGAAPCRLQSPAPGFAVQDWRQLRTAAAKAIREAAGEAKARGATVAGISVGAALHAVTAVNASGQPLAPLITWADTRASAEAERLAVGPDNLARQRRTGTPSHAMTPLAKIVWLRKHQPGLFAAACRWVGIKELMLSFLTGEWLVDYSCASGTGLFNLRTLGWDAEAMGIVGIQAEQLCRPVPTTQVVGVLSSAAAAALRLAPSTPVVAGAADGPLANLGIGAVSPGVAAVSIGTSGALRVTLAQPMVDEQAVLFCYPLTDDLWTVGGAINNGGVVLDWLAATLTPHIKGQRKYALLDEAGTAPPGCEGLLMLPYLFGERAPYWDAQAQGALVGLTYRHRRAHLVRAALEGVSQQLALVLESVREAGHSVHEIRATGGFAQSKLWRQVLTDALGQAIIFPETDGGSSFGAAFLGMQALEMIESLDVVSGYVKIQEIREPDERSKAVLAAQRPTFASLYHALRPTFRELQARAQPVTGEVPSVPGMREQEPASAGSTGPGNG